MTGPTFHGSCHCGNIAFDLHWPEATDRIPARACQCTFCRKHGAAWTSHPDGQLAVTVRDPSRVERYAFGTHTVDPVKIEEAIRDHFKMTPKGIIDSLDLRRPIYKATSFHGHFGRKPGELGANTFTWEKTDKAAALKSAVSNLAGAGVVAAAR